MKKLITISALLLATVLNGTEWPKPDSTHVEMPTPIILGRDGAFSGEAFTLIDPVTGIPSSIDVDEFRQVLSTKGVDTKEISDVSGYVALKDMSVLIPEAEFTWDAENAAVIFVAPQNWIKELGEPESDGRISYYSNQDQRVKAATLSGYVNLRGRVSSDHNGNDIATMRTESVVNFKGFAFVNDMTLTDRSGSPRESHLEYTAVTYETKNWQFTAGDLRVPTRGLQLSSTIGGLHISKGVSRWNQLVRGASDSFVVDTPSSLDIYQDGQLIRTEYIRPGTYSLREFGIINGDTTTSARITDEAGQVRELEAKAYTNLLDDGEWAGLLSIGLKRERGDGIFGEYGSPLFGLPESPDHDNLLVHAFVERGIGRGFEIGADFQSDTWGGMEGLSIRYDSGVMEYNGSRVSGQLSTALTQMYEEKRKSGGVYGSLSYSHPTYGSLSGTISWRDDGFESPYTERLWGASGNYTLAMGQYQHSLTASVSKARNGSETTRNYRYSLTRKIGKDWRIGFSASHRNGADKSEETDAYFTVSWTPSSANPNRRYSVYGSAGTDGVQGTGTYDRNKGSSFYGLSTTGRYDEGSSYGELYAYYYNQRLTSSVSLSRMRHDGQGSNLSSANFGTAFVFADGNWSVSQPIDDSFVLIQTHPNWTDQGMRVTANPDYWGGNQGSSSAFLPAVLPVNAHPDGNAFYVGLEGDSMLSLDRSDYRTELGPNQGGTLVVGDAASVMVMGYLYMPNGRPLAKTRIRLVHESGTIVSTFTSSSGRFSEGPLAEGTWKVEALGSLHAEFTAADPDSFGVANLGEIHMDGVMPDNIMNDGGPQIRFATSEPE